jgi:hypothetical protein
LVAVVTLHAHQDLSIEHAQVQHPDYARRQQWCQGAVKFQGPAHHLSACPMRAMSRDGGTMVTSDDSACAICARRLSFGVAPYTSLSRHQGTKDRCRFRSDTWSIRTSQCSTCADQAQLRDNYSRSRRGLYSAGSYS